MKIIKYNKLIRDKIPDIIEKSGKKCVVEIMDNDEYIQFLDAKLNEELAEYQADKSLEELADLLEVIYAVTEAHGYSIEELVLEFIHAKQFKLRCSRLFFPYHFFALAF